MSRIGKVLDFLRINRNNANQSQVVMNPGGNSQKTAAHFSDSGDDSFPLNGDYVGTSRNETTGGESAFGYVDIINESIASAGEKRIYSRNPNTGKPVAHIYLKSDKTIEVKNEFCSTIHYPDGSLECKNELGYFKLDELGNFIVNGVTISPEGLINTPVGIVTPSAIVNEKEIADHIHTAGTPPGNTGVNI